MRWIYEILRAVFDSLIPYLDKKLNAPHTLEDAKTPSDVKRRWDDYVAERLRFQSGGDRQPEGHSEVGQERKG